MIGYIIGLIVAGLVVGALGRLLHRGRDPMGIGMTIVVGIVSMLAVGILLRDAVGPVLSFALAVAVAVGIVAIWSHYTRRRTGLARRW